MELAALEQLEKIPIDLQWDKCCDHSSAFILNGSSSFLQVTRSAIKAWITLLFCQIQQLTTELPALECLKINVSTFSQLLLI